MSNPNTEALDPEAGDDITAIVALPELTDEEFEIVIVDEEEAPAEEAAAETPAAEEADPDADPEAEEVEEDESEEEDAEIVELRKHMRPKFTKRLNREIRAKKEAQAVAEEAKAIAINAATFAKSRDTELTKLKFQYADTLEESIAERISYRNSDLKRAREEGKFDDETRLQSEIDDLRYRLNQVKDIKRGMGEMPVDTPPTDRVASPAPVVPPARAPRAQKWLDANATWFDNEDFEVERAATLTIDVRLTQEGYNKNTPEYYKELDKRLDAKFPSLRKKATTTTRSPVAPAARSTPASTPAAKKRVTLTREDLANMQRFGLDYTNKVHLQEYVRQKRASA